MQTSHLRRPFIESDKQTLQSVAAFCFPEANLLIIKFDWSSRLAGPLSGKQKIKKILCALCVSAVNRKSAIKKPLPPGNGFKSIRQYAVCRFPTLELPRSGSTGVISGSEATPKFDPVEI
jgi:hypothetical protein